MLFRAPAGQRRSARMSTGVFALMGICFLFLADAVANPAPIRFAGLSDALLLIAALTYLSGPNDVRLDVGRRTYEWTVGWPWQPHIHTGTFDDIQGIQVKQQGIVVLLMRRRAGIRSQVVLGSRMSREQAAVLTKQVSQATGIPVVPSR